MNKKQIRLTESDLKQIIKESINKILNEAYGTPNNDTRAALDNLFVAQHYGSENDLQQDTNGEIPFRGLIDFNNGILKLEHQLTDVVRRDEIDDSNPYIMALFNHLMQMKELSRRMVKRLKMNQGEQPDETYNIKHLPPSQRYSKMMSNTSFGGGEDRHDYSGLAGWGG